jgi:hypothetical protein
MIEALTKAGVPARAEILVDANPGRGGRERQRRLAHTLEFFDENLKPAVSSAKPAP